MICVEVERGRLVEEVVRFQNIVEGETGFVQWWKRGRFGSLLARVA